MLLEREEVNPDHVDTWYGWTPLSIAASRGREGVVKMLLEREEVNPDHVDRKYGSAPLWWAAMGGPLEVLVRCRKCRLNVKENTIMSDYLLDSKTGLTKIEYIELLSARPLGTLRSSG